MPFERFERSMRRATYRRLKSTCHLNGWVQWQAGGGADELRLDGLRVDVMRMEMLELSGRWLWLALS